MDEYVCITVLSRTGEDQADFASRLSRFWTHLLRTRKADFEKVYAETTSFEETGDGWSRQYLTHLDVVSVVETELRTAGLDFEPIDRDELYSKWRSTGGGSRPQPLGPPSSRPRIGPPNTSTSGFDRAPFSSASSQPGGASTSWSINTSNSPRAR